MAYLAGEVGAEEGFDEFAGKFDADDAGAEAEDVHVVVLDGLMGGVGVVTEAGADAVDFVGGDGGADAGAADKDAAVGFAALDGVADFAGEVRIIVGLGAIVGAEVDYDVALFFEVANDCFVKRIAAVIGTYCDDHGEG